MNLVLLQVERVNDSIISDAGTIPIGCLKPMMRKGSEAQADFIDLRFDAFPDAARQV
jgi:hypothetical protein